MILEPITEAHAVELCELFADSALHTFVPFEPPTPQQQLDRCAKWAKRVSPDGQEIWLNWAARHKNNKSLVGHFQAGVKSDGIGSTGYVVARSFQRKGLASEALETIFSYLRDNLKVREVKAWSDSRNEASHALAKKLGMVQVDFVKDADHFKGASSDELIFLKTLGEPHLILENNHGKKDS